MTGAKESLIIIGVIALVTAALRFTPFILFSKKTPKAVSYLGKVLPFAVMSMLVVYCLKDVHILSGSHGIPELISIAVVVLLHKLWHNTLLSIFAGTIIYMLLVQLVFV